MKTVVCDWTSFLGIEEEMTSFNWIIKNKKEMTSLRLRIKREEENEVILLLGNDKEMTC